MKINTLASAKIQGKVVLVRVDYNVPVENGKVVENTRIAESIPTIKLLIKEGATQIHLLSHLGRPKGAPEEKYSLAPVAAELEKLLGEKVEFRKDFSSGAGKVQLHENVRFYPGEEKNDPALAQEILEKTKADIFVNDGFGVSHRAQSSVVGFTGKIPCYAGLLIEKEIKYLAPFLSDKKIPGLAVVVGGAKMETKIEILKHFAATAENILIGGALANTFLVAEGYDVGKSLYEEDQVETAREVVALCTKNKTGLHLPVDVVCSDDLETDEILDMPVEDVMGVSRIFDIGPHTVSSYGEIIKHSKMVIWNGPMGFFEKDVFLKGTKQVANLIAKNKSAQTIIGGGDTITAIQACGIDKKEFTHVSTGGGAMLEFLEGKELPGIKVLESN